MPNKQSAKKAVRQNKKRQRRNLVYKKQIKELTKKALSLLKAGNQGEAKEILPRLYKAVDKAAKIGVLKKNTAARRKSRVARKVSPAPTSQTPAQPEPQKE